MKNFLKTLLASVLGTFIAIFIVLVISIVIILGIASGLSSEKTTVKSNTILTIDLEKPITDRTFDNPLAGIIPMNTEGLAIRDITMAISQAKVDDNIKGIVMRSKYSPNSYATLSELREALIDFKESKKFVYVHVESMEEHAFYIHSIADKVFMHPMGDLLLNGTSYSVAYLKDMFDKLGVKVELIRHGKYKSAGEPLVANKMSVENREQINSYTGDVYDAYMKGIAESRNIKLSNLKQISSKLMVQNAQDAVQYGLIDSLLYFDEFENMLKEQLNVSYKKELRYVDVSKYAKTMNEDKKSKADKIALIYATGEIVSGEGQRDQMGSDEIVKSLHRVRKDSTIKAVVLRINSPGGSALASDVIWREVVLTKNVKPVIVSMGDVAASGGYYIAAPATKIVAQPATITGSIGVFGAIFVADKLINDKLGIRFEKVNQGEFADLGSPDRPMKASERAILQNMIDKIYDDFISKVAEGRNMSKTTIDEIAQGRVWAGTTALKIGLVDTLGTLNTAIRIAASEAQLDEYVITEYPRQKTFFEEFFKGFQAQMHDAYVNEMLGPWSSVYKETRSLMNMKGIQARMPYIITQ
jgi:protease-4